MTEPETVPTARGRVTSRVPLDGDREAQPLADLLARRLEARQEAARTLAEVSALVPELEDELRRLDESIAELEAGMRDTARRNEHSRAVARPAALATEIRARLTASLEEVRRAVAARPSGPIPVERLAPGFALGVRRAGTPGVRSARSVAQKMIERIENKERR